jgi:uncharacterized protein YqeY
MRDAIGEALKEAMRARDPARTGTLRMISAAIKDRDIEARGKGKGPASDEDLLAALAKMIRQREESAKMYATGAAPSSPTRSARKSRSSAASCPGR